MHPKQKEKRKNVDVEKNEHKMKEKCFVRNIRGLEESC